MGEASRFLFFSKKDIFRHFLVGILWRVGLLISVGNVDLVLALFTYEKTSLGTSLSTCGCRYASSGV